MSKVNINYGNKCAQYSVPNDRLKDARDAGDSVEFSIIFLASSFLCSQTESTPSPAPLTRAVETVEKVPSQKLTIAKWDKTIENSLVLCSSEQHLAVFEPVVGDFCEVFSSKRFFDSLVR